MLGTFGLAWTEVVRRGRLGKMTILGSVSSQWIIYVTTGSVLIYFARSWVTLSSSG